MSDTPKVEKVTKFMVTLWDGDMYILEGYKSAEEIEYKLSLTEKTRMPNGDIIKTASVAKIQSYDSYRFQTDQKDRHKRGQFLRGGRWEDHQGEITNAHLERITGSMTALPAPSSTAKELPKG